MNKMCRHDTNRSVSLFIWGWVRLNQLGIPATLWSILPASDDRWWLWSSQWNKNWQGKSKYSEKTCPSATLSTTNPTWTELGSNPGRRNGNPVDNRLSYSTTLLSLFIYLLYFFSSTKLAINLKIIADFACRKFNISQTTINLYCIGRWYINFIGSNWVELSLIHTLQRQIPL
jgi:hypothetical protein